MAKWVRPKKITHAELDITELNNFLASLTFELLKLVSF